MEIDKKISFDRIIPLILFYQPCSKKLALDLYLRGIHNKTVFTIFHHVTVISTVFIRPYLFRHIERMEYFSGNP